VGFRRPEVLFSAAGVGFRTSPLPELG
jgi:hypothetical protein